MPTRLVQLKLVPALFGEEPNHRLLDPDVLSEPLELKEGGPVETASSFNWENRRKHQFYCF